MNLLVIRTKNPELLKTQYELLGFEFELHQHGKGPLHYTSEQLGFVFEIYPLTKSMTKADHSLRLGFEVDHLPEKITALASTSWKILEQSKQTAWGLVAVIQDMDGRKVALTNKTHQAEKSKNGNRR